MEDCSTSADQQSRKLDFHSLSLIEECQKDQMRLISNKHVRSAEVEDAELSISGYVLFRKDRSSAVERRGGGVSLYVREELSPVEFRPSTEYLEQIWCSLGDVDRRGLLLGVCYRTASQVFGYDINARLRDLLTELRDDRVLLMGDFNYPGVDWVRSDYGRASPKGVMFVDCLEDNFYEQCVKEPTRGVTSWIW